MTKLSTWDYRVVEHEDGTHSIHEIYYDSDGKVSAWAERQAGPSGDSRAEMIEDLLHMIRAVGEPTIHEKDLPR